MIVGFSRLLLLMAFIMPIVSCGGDTTNSISIRIAVSKTPLSSTIYIAAAQDYFAQCGLDVTLTEYAGGLRSMNALLDGAADFATGSDTLFAFNAQNHKDLAIIAGLATSDHDTKILSRDLSAARGSFRLGYYPDTASEYLMRMYLALVPTIANLELVPLTPEEMVEAWQRGELDKAVIWEPHAFEMYKNSPNSTQIVDTKGLYKLNFQLLSRTSILTQTPEVTERMIHALNLAAYFIIQNQQEAKNIVKQQLGLDDDFIEWDWPNSQYKVNIGRQLLLTAQEDARWLKKVSNHKKSLTVDANQISAITLNMANPSFEASNQFCDRL